MDPLGPPYGLEDEEPHFFLPDIDELTDVGGILPASAGALGVATADFADPTPALPKRKWSAPPGFAKIDPVEAARVERRRAVANEWMSLLQELDLLAHSPAILEAIDACQAEEVSIRYINIIEFAFALGETDCPDSAKRLIVRRLNTLQRETDQVQQVREREPPNSKLVQEESAVMKSEEDGSFTRLRPRVSDGSGGSSATVSLSSQESPRMSPGIWCDPSTIVEDVGNESNIGDNNGSPLHMSDDQTGTVVDATPNGDKETLDISHNDIKSVETKHIPSADLPPNELTPSNSDSPTENGHPENENADDATSESVIIASDVVDRFDGAKQQSDTGEVSSRSIEQEFGETTTDDSAENVDIGDVAEESNERHFCSSEPKQATVSELSEGINLEEGVGRNVQSAETLHKEEVQIVESEPDAESDDVADVNRNKALDSPGASESRDTNPHPPAFLSVNKARADEWSKRSKKKKKKALISHGGSPAHVVAPDPTVEQFDSSPILEKSGDSLFQREKIQDVLSIVQKGIIEAHRMVYYSDRDVKFILAFIFFFPEIVRFTVGSHAPSWASVLFLYAFIIHVLCTSSGISAKTWKTSVLRKVIPLIFILDCVSQPSVLLACDRYELLSTAILIAAVKCVDSLNPMVVITVASQTLLTTISRDVFCPAVSIGACDWIMLYCQALVGICGLMFAKAS